MISRSPIFIYKPYCCAASSSTFYQHLTSCLSSDSVIRKRFHSAINNIKLQQCNSEVCNTKINFQTISAVCNKFDIFDAAKFIGKLNNNNVDNQRCLSLNIYPIFVQHTQTHNVLSLGALFTPDKQKLNFLCNYFDSNGKKIETTGLQNCASCTKPILSCDDGIQYWKDEPKKKPKTDTDSPSEKQLNEMMMYFFEQAPKLFSTTGWSYSKCSYKIKFENMMLGTKTDTLNAYIMQINIMKNITKLIISNPELSIIKMTKDLENGSLQIRWQVQGVPRYMLPFTFLGIVNEKRSVRYIDGFSIFYVNNDGLYHRHLLLKMTPLQSELRRMPLSQVVPELYGIYGHPLRPSVEFTAGSEK